jgi:hypothetical protein
MLIVVSGLDIDFVTRKRGMSGATKKNVLQRRSLCGQITLSEYDWSSRRHGAIPTRRPPDRKHFADAG